MIFIQQHHSSDNEGGRRIAVDADRAVEVYDNAGALWIEIKSGGGQRSALVIQPDTALALALLLCERAGVEVVAL